MNAGIARLSWLAVAAAATAAVAGCSGSSSTTPAADGGTATTPGAAGSASALSAVQLAAKTGASVTSAAGTIRVQFTSKPGTTPAASGSGSNLSLTASFAERLKPSVLASVDTTAFSALPAGDGFSEVLTPSTLYLKLKAPSAGAAANNQWYSMSVSQLSQAGGVDITQFLGNPGSGGLAQSQLLGGASAVRKAGAGNIGGTPVTEYTGTISPSAAVARLTGSARTAVQQQIDKGEFTSARFTAWIDGQHLLRRFDLTELGKTGTEMLSTTLTSVNQPVTINLPAASAVKPLPSGALPSAG